MGLFQFQCTHQDKLLKSLIKIYHATPLLVPDSGTKPLNIVARRGSKTKNRGDLGGILVNADAVLPKFKRSEQAGISFSETNEMKVDFGLKILDGFFKGFNLSMNPLKSVIDSNSTMTFEFKNVKREYVDINLLGRHLKECKLDLNNSAIHPFIREKRPMDMYLINSILKSNEFTVNITKSSTSTNSVEVPILEKITDVGVTVETKGDKTYSMTFKSKHYLTFAFSSVEIIFNREDGCFIGIGDEKAIKSLGDNPSEEQVIEVLDIKPESLIDEDVPALISWDEDED